MDFNKFSVKVSGMVILIGITLFAMVYVLLLGNLRVTAFNLLVFVIGECWYLIYMVKRTNRDLSRFFEAFRNNDTSNWFQARSRDSVYSDLYKSLNAVIGQYSRIQQEREGQYVFFDHLLQQLPVGIIVYDSNGKVTLVNRAFLSLLGIAKFQDIKTLESVKPGFSKCLMELKAGQYEVMALPYQSQIMQVSLKTSLFKAGQESLKMAVLQDVTSELQQAELESMQKMVSVLTHEMMNSSSPITLAAAGVIRHYEEMMNQDEHNISQENIQDHHAALLAIHKRSKGLTKFVEQYRQLLRLPLPNFEVMRVKQLFTNLEALLKDQMALLAIRFEVEVVPENLTILADEKMMEQVFLNLIKNAIEALDSVILPYIRLTAVNIGQQVILQVEDNGQGIPEELLDKIFTPMFTTKSNGTGIGLSLSRQMIYLHRGLIQVNSQPGVKTVFTIRL